MDFTDNKLIKLYKIGLNYIYVSLLNNIFMHILIKIII